MPMAHALLVLVFIKAVDQQIVRRMDALLKFGHIFQLECSRLIFDIWATTMVGRR